VSTPDQEMSPGPEFTTGLLLGLHVPPKLRAGFLRRAGDGDEQLRTTKRGFSRDWRAGLGGLALPVLGVFGRPPSVQPQQRCPGDVQ
jgi:hypothetical protein